MGIMNGFSNSERYCEDKTRTCDQCGKTVVILNNQVGGFWYLSRYKGGDGQTYSGGCCSECFDMISEMSCLRVSSSGTERK